MAEQMQPEVGVMRVSGRFIQRGDGGAHSNDIDFAAGITNERRRHMLAKRSTRFFRCEMARAGSGRVISQRRARIPGIKDGAIGG